MSFLFLSLALNFFNFFFLQALILSKDDYRSSSARLSHGDEDDNNAGAGEEANGGTRFLLSIDEKEGLSEAGPTNQQTKISRDRFVSDGPHSHPEQGRGAD